ncbi:MAG: BREX system P-loop protein BrxC, partial [Gammaproteobacteria bacterium]|nr:BREX system P-loop protein BrxC [Gammaproteobacteria bacterium]
MRNEAIQFGNQSPIIVVFIPKSPSLQLRRYLTEYKAAADTISGYGLIFESADDIASENMTKIRDTAEEKVDLLLDTAFSNSFVLKAGGKEVKGITMQESVSLAAEEALQRLYPQFSLADNIGWSEVYEQASRGTPNALKAVSYEGEPENNPVCKAIIDFITVGKMGSEIQDKFQSPPYGWPIDAVDGGLQVLLAAELARAIDERNRTFDPRSLDRKDLSKSLFKLESATVSNTQRDQICSLMDKVGINSEVGKELFHLSLFLDKLDDLVVQAGGDPPRPIRPVSSLLEKIRGKSGNESLLILFENREELGESIDEWQCLTKGINKRLPNWNKLKTLADQASMLDDTEEILSQV